MTRQNKTLRVVFIAAICFVFILSIFSYIKINSLIESAALVNHTSQVTLQLEKVISTLKDAETSQRGYLLTHDKIFLDFFTKGLNEYPQNIEAVKRLTIDNPEQQKNLLAFELLAQHREKRLLKMLEIDKLRTPTAAELLIGKSIMDSLRTEVNTMINRENILMQYRSKELHKQTMIAPAMLYALSLIALAILIISYWQLNKSLLLAQQLQSDVIHKTVQLEKSNLIESNQQQLQLIFRQAPAAIAVLEGTAHKYTLANAAYQKMTNRSEEQLLGKSLRDVFPEVEATGIFEIFDNVFKTGETFSAAEFPVMYDKNNDRILQQAYFNFTIEPIKNDDGKFSFLMVLAIDITEQVASRKKIEESEELLRKTTDHFELATNAAEVGTWSLNLATETLDWSALHKKMWGYDELRSDLVYEDWHKVIFTEDKEAAFAEVAKALKTKTLYEAVYRIGRDNDGEVRWMKSSGQYYYNEKDEPVTLTGVSIDITNDKIAEEKLLASEERFRLATKASGVGIWEWNVITNKIRWDALMFRIYGVPPTADGFVEYSTWSNAVAPEDLSVQEKILQDTVKNVGTSNRNFKIYRANDGMLRFIEAIETVRTNATGQAEWVVGTNLDVTEKVLARKKVEDSEKRYNLMLMQSPFAFLILKGKDMVVHLANESMKEVLGKGSDIEGKPLSEVLPEIKGQAFPGLLDNVYNTGIPFSANEMRAQLTRNGKLEDVYFNYVYQPYYEADKTISGVTVIAYDVTSQVELNKKIKESEERFRSLAQTLPQLVWVTDAQGNAEFASYRWKEYSGIEPGGEKEWKAIVHPDDYDNINAAWVHSLTTGNIYTFDVRLKSKEGEYRWHLVKGEPILDKENKIVKWAGAFIDIHDQKMKDEKKDEFISIASHEMKTPLTTAKAYLQMLELSLGENNKDANLYAKKASQSVSRLNGLISELLDVSKIRLGKLNYMFTTFNFNDMIASTVENVQLTSQTHTIIKAGKVNNEVTGDKDRLQQVVINLLNNAIKYSPGAENVFITVEQEKDRIKVSVKDTGIGIARHSLDKIFEKYHRVEEHAVHFQGLGIGLFISYEIIQRHHGKLWADSEVGKGSTFYFTIPAGSILQQ